MSLLEERSHLTNVVRGHHDVGAVCLCQSTHRPEPLEYVQHHIHPLGMGGPDVPGNRVWLCPTAHYNVHELLRAMVREEGVIPLSTFSGIYVVPVNRYAYAVALDGYRRWLYSLAQSPPVPSR